MKSTWLRASLLPLSKFSVDFYATVRYPCRISEKESRVSNLNEGRFHDTAKVRKDDTHTVTREDTMTDDIWTNVRKMCTLAMASQLVVLNLECTVFIWFTIDDDVAKPRGPPGHLRKTLTL